MLIDLYIQKSYDRKLSLSKIWGSCSHLLFIFIYIVSFRMHCVFATKACNLDIWKKEERGLNTRLDYVCECGNKVFYWAMVGWPKWQGCNMILIISLLVFCWKWRPIRINHINRNCEKQSCYLVNAKYIFARSLSNANYGPAQQGAIFITRAFLLIYFSFWIYIYIFFSK